MAPNKRARHRSTNENSEKYKNLIISDVLCPICRNILIEPVTLPCNHGFCLACFNGTMENTALTCPLCRIRIGSWLRSARKDNKIINEVLWRIMQLKFSNEIRQKLEGGDITLQEDLPKKILAKAGEIRKEYELQLQKERSEIQKERDSESKASEMVIKKILEEEQNAARLEEEKLRLDEEIARKLAAEEDKNKKNTLQLQTTPKSSKKSSIDKYLIALSKRKQGQEANKSKNEPIPSSSKSDNDDKVIGNTPMSKTTESSEPSTSNQSSVRVMYQKVEVKQQCSKAYQHLLLSKTLQCERAESISSDSGDSINQEMRYFKPIRAAPAADSRGKTNLALPLLKITPTVPVSPSSVVIRSPQRNMLVRIGAHPRSAFVSCSPEIEKVPSKVKKLPISKDGKVIKQYYNRNQYTLNTNIKSNSPENHITSPCLGFQLENEQKHITIMRDVISTMSEHVNSFSARHSDSRNILVETPKQNLTTSKKCTKISPQKIVQLTPKKFVKYSPKKILETPPKKINGCDVKLNDEKHCKLQEKLDLEFAKRLHEELNNPRTRPTRASNQYKKMAVVKTRSSPRKRQITLDEFIAPKKFKI